jgi:hypothetical protein
METWVVRTRRVRIFPMAKTVRFAPFGRANREAIGGSERPGVRVSEEAVPRCTQEPGTGRYLAVPRTDAPATGSRMRRRIRRSLQAARSERWVPATPCLVPAESRRGSGTCAGLISQYRYMSDLTNRKRASYQYTGSDRLHIGLTNCEIEPNYPTGSTECSRQSREP